MKHPQPNKKPKKTTHPARPPPDLFRNRDLVTVQQQQIMNSSPQKDAPRMQRHDHLQTNMEEQEETEVPMAEITKVDADKLSIMVGQLLAKNKINAKNAFEVPLIHVNQTGAFAETSNDNSWKRLSSALQSNNKIYGYRVDATHNYTYQVLEWLTRQEKPEGEVREDEGGYRRERPEVNSLNSQFVYRDEDDCYAKHLQKNFKNINILHLETFFNVNPVLEKTKRIFDQNGLSALLLNNLDVRVDLSLSLSFMQQAKIELVTATPQEMLILCDMDCGGVLEGRNIFCVMESVCQIQQLDEGQHDGWMVKRQGNQMQLLWNQFESECVSKYRRRAVKIETVQQDRKEQCPPQHVDAIIDVGDSFQPLLDLNGNTLSYGALQSYPTIQPKRQEPQALVPQQQHSSSHLQTPPESALSPSQTPQTNQEYPQQPSSSASPLDSALSNLNHLQGPSTFNSILSDQLSFISAANNTANMVQISDYIKMSNFHISTDLLLREIGCEEGEAEGKDDFVSRWKAGEAVIRKKREHRPRQPQPIIDIDFLSETDGITLRRRGVVLSLDKKKRTQFKKILKELGIKGYRERNSIINTRQWKMDMQLKTLLKQYLQPRAEVTAQYIPQGEVYSGEERVIIDLSGEGDESRWAAIKRNSCIREAKEVIRSHIESSMEDSVQFANIYSYFLECNSFISPALCFLTLLHLTNEHNYTLTQRQGEFNFVITKQ